MSDVQLSGGELEGGAVKKGEKHSPHKHHNGRSGLNKKERSKVRGAHHKKTGSPVVKLTEKGVEGIRMAISDYKKHEWDAAQHEVSKASTSEEKAMHIAAAEGMKRTAKLAKSAVEKMDMAESKIVQGKPAAPALTSSSTAAKETYGSAVKQVTGVVIGHSAEAKAARKAHRMRTGSASPRGRPRGSSKSPSHKKHKSPKGMKRDGTPRQLNAWHEHLKNYRKTHNVAGMTAPEVAKLAKKSYHK